MDKIKDLEQVCKSNITDLVVLDSKQANSLIDKMFDGDHDLTLEALSKMPELKYEYIQNHFKAKEKEMNEAYKALGLNRPLREKYDKLLLTNFQLICDLSQTKGKGISDQDIVDELKARKDYYPLD